jgi:lipid-A-disaccharide synthase
MGGERMKAAEVELFAELDELAVMGFVEVLPKIPYFKRLERRLQALLDRERPELVILVDYPGFNLRIARAAHERGCTVLYYIAPKVWAWRTGRAKALAETTDGVAVILPFESEFLAGHGVNAEYVGHPLLDRPDDVTPRAAFFKRWGLDPSRPLLALLPGSRPQELTRHVDAFRRIAERVMEERPDVLPVFSRAPTVSAMPFHETGLPVVEDTRALLRWSDAALVKSGTSTLESVLEDTPFVIAYRTSRITSTLARRVMHVDHIGLPNLVADARVVPEYLQDDVNADRIAPVLLALLDERSETRARQLGGLAEIRGRLGTPGASARVADMACDLMTAKAEGRPGEGMRKDP